MREDQGEPRALQPVAAARRVFSSTEHLWLLDPLARRLEVFARARDGWTRLEEHSGVAIVSAPPFEGATIELAPLWG